MARTSGAARIPAVFGDAPRARDYASTHVSQYNQIKRWAWGATDVPYVCVRMLSHPEIPWRLRAAASAS
jgi:hypothetical protein